MAGANLLDRWTAQKIGLGNGVLERAALNRYQRERLSETLRFVAVHSPFYRERLGQYAQTGLESLTEVAELPFTTETDLRQRGPEMVCVSQSQVSRVVTLQTSGTAGEAKRLWFTSEDQNLTVDFFRVGMSTLVQPKDRVLILLPGKRPGSVGDLLAQALKKLGVAAIPHGPVRDLADTMQMMGKERVTSIVGIPVQILALARYSEEQNANGGKIKSVLMSSDSAADSLIQEVKKIWGCPVFDHYGMTEMGLGGGLECAGHSGFHLREADLYFEIVDPATGKPVQEGHEGEIVFSTLTRRGMPLIRYRTGDMSRFLPEPCVCGSVLKRLSRIHRRSGSGIQLPDGTVLTLRSLDEALFAISGVVDFVAEVDEAQGLVGIDLLTIGVDDAAVSQAVAEKMTRLFAEAETRQGVRLRRRIQVNKCDGKLLLGFGKRVIKKAKGSYGPE